MSSAATEWRQGWTLVLASMMAYSMVAVPSITLGLFMEPVTREFGWSRAEFSFGLTVVALITTPLVPFAGALADRFGARRLALPGTALHALAFAAFGLLTPSLWHWLAAWAIYAVMQLSIRSMVWTGAISAAFVTSRGLALAVFMSGTAIATVLGPLATRWLVDDYGWRVAFVAIGLVWGGFGFVLVALFFHDFRHQTKRKTDVDAASAGREEPPPALGGLTVRQAVRDWRIIRVGFAMTVVSLISSGFMLHFVPMLSGGGMDRMTATQIVALTGFSGIISQLGVGFLLDRVRGTWLAAACFGLPSLGYAALVPLLGGSTAVLTCLALLISLGTAATLNITIYLVTRYAGLPSFGAIFGIISSCMGMAGGIGPLLAGWIFDASGSYTAYLWLAAGSALVTSAALVRLGPFPVFALVQPGESVSPAQSQPDS